MADLIGLEVVSVRGEKIGKIDQLYVHGGRRISTAIWARPTRDRKEVEILDRNG